MTNTHDFRTFNRTRIDELLAEHNRLVGTGNVKHSALLFSDIIHRVLAHIEVNGVPQRNAEPISGSSETVLTLLAEIESLKARLAQLEGQVPAGKFEGDDRQSDWVEMMENLESHGVPVPLSWNPEVEAIAQVEALIASEVLDEIVADLIEGVADEREVTAPADPAAEPAAKPEHPAKHASKRKPKA